MRRWLARFGFAFLVLAFALAWEGHRAATGESAGAPSGRAPFYYAGAAALAALGLAGIIERHRPPDA